jgi:hypothetical protein
MRKQAVMVALVYDESKGFLISFNSKWRAYAFPMRKPRSVDFKPEGVAIRALAECLGQRTLSAEARPLEYLELEGPSLRTGRETCYFYQVFEVDPGLDLPVGRLGSRTGFLPYEALLESDLVTWSTKELARALMEEQHVALAVITREGASGREYLMLRNANYRGYFFPASRLKTDTTPKKAAVAAIRGDTGYDSPITIHEESAQTVADEHFSRRFNRERKYLFHVMKATLGDFDLTKRKNPLEVALSRTGRPWRWFTEKQLEDPQAHDLSPTVTAVLKAVIQVASA